MAHVPIDAHVLTDEDVDPLRWDEVSERLAAAQTYWLATTHPDGRPQVRPVLGVWVGGALHTTTSPDARKARNLRDDGRCALSVTTDGMDLAYEGTARRVIDHAHLERIAQAYAEKYGWPVTIAGSAFDAPYGAPTAGPPPYQPYEIVPATVFAFGTDDDHAPRTTRWRF